MKNPFENGTTTPDPMEGEITWEDLMARLDDLIPLLHMPHAQEVMRRKSMGLSLEEIGEQVGLTPKQVDKIQRRSLRALQAVLRRHENAKNSLTSPENSL